MKKHQQSGFTLIELLACIFGLGIVAVIITAGYTLVHFIAKFW